MYDLYSVNVNPNIEYILRRTKPEIESLKKGDKLYKTIYHPNGWWEAVVDNNTKKKKDKYGKISFYKSEERESYLRNSINNLKEYGEVILIRLPVSNKVFAAEENWFPDFNSYMEELAEGQNIKFLNYSQLENDSIYYYDNKSHMDGKSAKFFTQTLSKDIKQILTQDE